MRYMPCVFLVFALGCQSAPNATPTPEPDVTEPTSSAWEVACAEARAELAQTESTRLTYTELPANPQGLAYWSLAWGGIEVPLPAGRYADVILTRQPDGTPAESLLMTNDDTVLLLVHDNQNLDELNGKTAGEVVYQAYGWTADDVACTTATQEEDTLRMKALALKGLPPGATVVHKDVGKHTGYLVSGTRGGKAYWEAFFTTETWDSEQVGVAYVLSGSNDDFGLLLGKASGDTPSAGARPVWLDPLQAFLEDPTDANLSAFEGAAAKDGLGAKTTASITQWRTPTP